MTRRPRINVITRGRFKTYTRFCKKCDNIFVSYSRTSSVCLECKSTQQQVRYFNKFPNRNELGVDEKKIYKKLIETGKYIIPDLV